MSAPMLKLQNRYSAADLEVGDHVMIDEQEQVGFRHRFKGLITRIDGDALTVQIDHIHDAEIGGEVHHSSRWNKGDDFIIDAAYIFRVLRLDGEDI